MMKKLAVLVLLGVTSNGCFLFDGPGFWPAEKTAVYFLNELKEGNVVEAKKYCTPKVRLFIDSCLMNGVNVRIVKVSDVKCTIKNDTGTCEFCCLNDTAYSTFKIIREREGKTYKDNGWVIDDLSALLEK